MIPVVTGQVVAPARCRAVAPERLAVRRGPQQETDEVVDVDQRQPRRAEADHEVHTRPLDRLEDRGDLRVAAPVDDARPHDRDRQPSRPPLEGLLPRPLAAAVVGDGRGRVALVALLPATRRRPGGCEAGDVHEPRRHRQRGAGVGEPGRRQPVGPQQARP